MNKDESITFIKDFLHRIDTQDNRATASPIQFLLQVKKKVITDSDYHYDSLEWYHPIFENCGYETEHEAIAELKEYFGSDKDKLEKALNELKEIFFQDVWETKQSFFTEEAYNHHVKINKHNLGEYRSYVVHCFRDYETLDLFKALRGVVK